MSKEDKEDIINHPSHYTQGIQPIEAMKHWLSPEEFTGAMKANIIKYVARANFKGKELQDLKKAKFYLDSLVKHLESLEEKRNEDYK